MHCTHSPALARVVAQKSSAPFVFTMQRPSASISDMHDTQVKVPAIPLSQSDASGELGQSLSVTHWWHSPVLVSQRRPSGQFAVPIVLHGWQVPPTQIGLAASGHGPGWPLPKSLRQATQVESVTSQYGVLVSMHAVSSPVVHWTHWPIMFPDVSTSVLRQAGVAPEQVGSLPAAMVQDTQ